MATSSSQELGGMSGVWRRVWMLNSFVLSLSTTVRAARDSRREASQTFSASLRIGSSVSERGMSCSKVSSAEMDFVGLFGRTG